MQPYYPPMQLILLDADERLEQLEQARTRRLDLERWMASGGEAHGSIRPQGRLGRLTRALAGIAAPEGESMRAELRT